MESDRLLTRDEVLEGLPAKRACSLLFLIESRTAHLVHRSRNLIVPFQTEETIREDELAFIEAFALGREPPLRPTIQDLERHAVEWADLVPGNARLRAAVAQLLGEKYLFRRADVPALRGALGLDDPTVRQAYQRLYREPLDAIYAMRRPPMDRLRWAVSTFGGVIESLPPFWIVYTLTLCGTAGIGGLILPVVLTGLGPLLGLALVVGLGLVNTITIVWLAETAARTASIRYGNAYFGNMVTQYLGRAGGVLLSIALAIICVASVLANAVGLSTTLASSTGIPAPAWIVAHCAALAFVISRVARHATLASALALGLVKIALGLVLVALAYRHFDLSNLADAQGPGLDELPFEPALIGLVFGVITSNFLGHHLVRSSATLSLRRDPSARSLIWGVAASQVTAIVIYSVSVVGIMGGISPTALAGQSGPAFEPLADVAGPIVFVIGTPFAILAMGLGSVNTGAALVSTVRDVLPRQSHPVVLLPRGHGQLVFTTRGGDADNAPRLMLTYAGLTGTQPRLLLQARVPGHPQRVERVGTAPWVVREALDRLPADVLDGIDLIVEPVTAETTQVRLRITTRMRMEFQGSWTTAGLDLGSLLDASGTADPDADLLRWMLRRGSVRLDEVASWTGEDASQASTRMQALVARGAVRKVIESDATTYRATVARRRARHVPEEIPHVTGSPPRVGTAVTGGSARWNTAWVADRLLEGRGRRMLEYAPLVLIFVVALWLILTGRDSYNYLVSLSGMLAVPIFAGLFPCLLLVASRRRGDLVPGVVSRLLARPWLIVGVYALFLGSILLHGLVIWENPVERIAALAVGGLMLGVTALAIRHGAFARRTVVNLREDGRSGGTAVFEIVSGGQYAMADTRLDYAGTSRSVTAATIQGPELSALKQITALLPFDPAVDLKLWANRVTPDGSVESLPVCARVQCGTEEHTIDLRAAGGQVILPRRGASCAVVLALDEPSSPVARARRSSPMAQVPGRDAARARPLAARQPPGADGTPG